MSGLEIYLEEIPGIHCPARDGLVVVCGSIFLVGDLKKNYKSG